MPALFLIILRLGRSIWTGLQDREFRGLFTLVLIVVATGAWFYHAYEGWSWLDATYFTIITLTTVGYGDFSPKTPEGKIFTIVYIFLGLGIISSFIIMVAEHHREETARRVRKIRQRRAMPGDQETEDNN